VLFVLGTVAVEQEAQAAQPRVDRVAAIRAVPAYALAPGADLRVGQAVKYEGESYVVAGKVMVK
jgi:hypothetical protein